MTSKIKFYQLKCKFKKIKTFFEIFSQILVLTGKSETRKKAFWRYVDTGYYMNRWLLGN